MIPSKMKFCSSIENTLYLQRYMLKNRASRNINFFDSHMESFTPNLFYNNNIIINRASLIKFLLHEFSSHKHPINILITKFILSNRSSMAKSNIEKLLLY